MATGESYATAIRTKGRTQSEYVKSETRNETGNKKMQDAAAWATSLVYQPSLLLLLLLLPPPPPMAQLQPVSWRTLHPGPRLVGHS